MVRKTAEERFWEKVDITLTCWEWTAALTHKGYGSFKAGYTSSRYAHRLSYAWEYGPIPAGMQVDHMCMNRSCVRPDHLRLVTNKQNMEHRSGTQANNTTGVRGVSRHTGGGYRAKVTHYGEEFAHWFPTIAEAEVWVVAKRAELFTHDDGVLA
jgi:hypothetical protein